MNQTTPAKVGEMFLVYYNFLSNQPSIALWEKTNEDLCVLIQGMTGRGGFTSSGSNFVEDAKFRMLTPEEQRGVRALLKLVDRLDLEALFGKEPA